MAWDYEFGDGVDVDADGIPRHPERGHAVCGYPKTDATANNGRKRGGEGDGCLQAAGWGTDRSTGACRKHHGASPGGPTGWQNGNARHLLYSEEMRDEDREVFEAVVDAGGDDGDLMSIDDMADMLKNSIGWEFTRLTRAIDQIPEAEKVEKYACPKCGNTYTKSPPAPLPERCTGFDMSGGHPEPCDRRAEHFKSTGEKFVSFSDKAVERKESHLANLIETYKKIAEGVDVNIDGDHNVTHEGGDDPVEVSINHVSITEPPDPDAEDGDEADVDGGET